MSEFQSGEYDQAEYYEKHRYDDFDAEEYRQQELKDRADYEAHKDDYSTGRDYISPDQLDCEDFVSQREAQEFFIKSGGPFSDPYWLDADGDGIACEWWD